MIFIICVQGGDAAPKVKKTVAAVPSSKTSPLAALFRAILPLLFVALAAYLALNYQKSSA